MLHRLSPAFVRNCTAPGVYLDGGGLRFRVMANGSRAYSATIWMRTARQSGCDEAAERFDD